ncbi:MAG: CocE/NonD family hydrolase [Planctomycetaceae bacterium]
MMHRKLSHLSPRQLAWFFFVVAATCHSVSAQEPPARAATDSRNVSADGIDLGRVTEQHIMIPMRDGVRLSAYIYQPPGRGPWPVVFEQRYASLRGKTTRQTAAKLASEKFIVALINFRGTHLSEGQWVGYRALQWGERQDGYDTCEWLAEQSWSTGKVGTFGSSQGGYAQNYLAVTRPPHLVCQYMTDTGLSLFQEGYRIGGTTRPQRFLGMDRVCRDPQDNRRLLAEWFRHPHYDAYWQAEDCTRHFDRMNVPCFTIGSWYDFMNQGSIASFQGRQHRGGPASRGQQHLLIGPWLHGRLNKSHRTGDLVYPQNAAWPVHDHMVRWFNHFLKDKNNGVERESTVRYYVMGAVGETGAPGNQWRNAKAFPPPSRPTRMFLQSGGGLSNAQPTDQDAQTDYVSDPLHPMQIPGRSFPGARDARSFEDQSDVRTFTTPPLTAPVEWTGRVQAELYVSSTAPDTDFIVRISDVYPDGRSILIVDYPWRARYRLGFDREALLQPGRVVKLAFPVGWMSQIFNTGHRIRVTIASTGAPLYEPNPQTGKPLTIDFPADAAKAVNTIHHNRRFASRIFAPLAR